MAKPMTQLRNATKGTLSLFQPAGRPDAHQVEAGAVVKVPGAVTDTTDDAIVVGDGANARAYSKKLWEVVDEPQPRQVEAPKARPEIKKDGERP